MKILFYTNDHLGDAVICTPVLRDIKESNPDIEIGFLSRYNDVFKGNPFVSYLEDSQESVLKRGYDLSIKLEYAPFSQRTGSGGNCVMAFHNNASASLGRLGRNVAFNHKVFDVYLSDKEKKNRYGDYWVINANCQNCSETKAYPWYQKIVDSCRDIKFIQIGSAEKRDLQTPLNRVVDLRGKTTVRDLIAIVAHSKGLISPPSAIVHIASAFKDVKSIVLNGAREPSILTKYDNTVHIETMCSLGYDGKLFGCMKFFMRNVDGRTCPRAFIKKSQKYPQCMTDINPERVVEEIRKNS